MAPRRITYLRRLTAVAWLTALAAVLALVLGTHVAPLSGHTLLIIRGASMAPAIPLGSLVAVNAADPGSIAVGDVVTVRSDSGVLVTHRVREVVNGTDRPLLRLQGDANPGPDEALVPISAVVGRVTSFVPLAGYALFLLTTPSGILACLSMLGWLLLAWWLLEDLEAGAQATARRRGSVIQQPGRGAG